MATRRQGRSNDRGTRRGGRAPAASAYDTGAAPTGSVDAAADTELQVDVADSAPAEPVRPLAAADDVKTWAEQPWAEQTWAEQTWAEDAADPIDHGGEAPADNIPSDGATQDALQSTRNDAERTGREGEIVFPGSTAPDDASHAPTSELASEDAAAVPMQMDDDVPPDALLPREIESAIASAQPVILPPPRALSVSALTEITAANDTLAAFLRNEGLATVAHWRALTTAKSPGDAIRLQVSEFQRAADASLNCMASLARRAGRIAATVGRA